jgi:hypothetical protein
MGLVWQAVARLEAEARTVEHELSAVQAAMTELNTAMDGKDAFTAVPPDVALRQAVGQSRLAGELLLDSIALFCLRPNVTKLMQSCFGSLMALGDGAAKVRCPGETALTNRQRVV